MSLHIQPTGGITPFVFITLTGQTLADVARDVSARSEVGKARFVLTYSYDSANGLLTNVDLTMTLTIGMPVWTNRDNRPKAEQDEWDRFHRALRYHEDGHIAIFRGHAHEAYEHLVHSTPHTIQRVYEQQKRHIQALSDTYDTHTHHGLIQRTPAGTTVITVPP